MNAEHGQILGHVVAEDRAEYAQVITAAITGPDYSFLIELVGDAKPGSEVGERRGDIQVKSNTLLAGHHDFSSRGIQEAALSGAGHLLRTIDFPAKPIVKGKFLGDAPGVLPEEEPAVLRLTGVE